METIAKYCDKTLTICNFDLSNSRKLMKVKIFLNSNNQLKYEVLQDSLIISFCILDENIISTEIKKILSFINNTYGISVSLDSKLEYKIDESEEKKNQFFESILRLNNVKRNNETDENFNLFCNYSDETLACKLRPYQYKAAYYLTIGNGGFDFSVPGSGKTIISYAAYNYLKYKKTCDYILIIGPINSYNAWNDEYETCFNKKPDFYSLANLDKNEAVAYLLSSKINHKEITFVNIDKAWRLKKEIIQFVSGKKILLIIDEGHKEKNPDAAITKAVMEITKFCSVRIILTGTPMPNGYEDLYSLMKIYEPYEKILPFNFSELKKLTKNGASFEQQKRIMDSIFPLYSRVSKKYLLETGELKEPHITIVNCELSDEQRKIYNFLNDFSYSIDNDFDSILNVSLMKAVLIRKMQTSANPGLLSKSIINSIEEYKREYYEEYDQENSDNEMLIKADNELKKLLVSSELATIIGRFESNFLTTPKNEIAVKLALKLVNSGQKVILWDVFVQNMLSIRQLIKKYYNGAVEVINGLIGGEDRLNALDNFKNGNSMIMIANPATLAESISLHKACQNAIYVNRNFNAAQFIQSKDRIHRINMPKGTTANYYFLINKDTVDEEVNDRLNLKENRMLRILDSSDVEIGGSEFDNNSFMSMDDIISSFKK